MTGTRVTTTPATDATVGPGRTGGQGLWAVLRRLPAGRTVLVAALLGGLAEAVFAIVAGGAVGWMVGAAASGTPVAGLWPVAVLALGSVLASAVGTWALSQYGHAFAFRSQADLRLQIFDGLERSAPHRVDGARTGDLAVTAMGDVEVLEEFFAHLGIGAVVAAVTGFAATVALVVIHPGLAVVAAAGMVLAGLAPIWLARRGRRRAEELGGEVGAVNSDVVDGVQGMRELVVFDGVASWWGRIARGSLATRRLRFAHARAVGAQAAITDALIAATVVGVLVVALSLAGAGTITLSAAGAAITITIAALGPVTSAVEMAGTLAPLRAGARRVLGLIDQPATVPDTAGAPVSVRLPTVRFEGVRFGYDPDRPVLHDVDLEIPAGGTLALVGRSGAGKSTCANLLLRFHDTDAGRVTIGGHDLREVPLSQLRRLVTVVSQEAHLFTGTVAENLRLAAPQATDADLEQAARAARAHEFVTALPGGYDTPVGERGALLSGGQRQRLTIARALLADAPVLVLDEASSHLDAENEQLIAQALRAAQRGRTTLVIAHRLSTVRTADVVAVLDAGRVIEMGPPDELAARGGAYADLVAGQRGALAAT